VEQADDEKMREGMGQGQRRHEGTRANRPPPQQQQQQQQQPTAKHSPTKTHLLDGSSGDVAELVLDTVNRLLVHRQLRPEVNALVIGEPLRQILVVERVAVVAAHSHTETQRT
jgi:hypothetical protein